MCSYLYGVCLYLSSNSPLVMLLLYIFPLHLDFVLLFIQYKIFGEQTIKKNQKLKKERTSWLNALEYKWQHKKQHWIKRRKTKEKKNRKWNGLKNVQKRLFLVQEYYFILSTKKKSRKILLLFTYKIILAKEVVPLEKKREKNNKSKISILMVFLRFHNVYCFVQCFFTYAHRIKGMWMCDYPFFAILLLHRLDNNWSDVKYFFLM